MANARTLWRLIGESATGCNCAWGCPCQFNALPTTGRCEGFAAHRIDEGHRGDLRLDGLLYAEIFWFPGPVHEGNGSHQLIVDSRASPQQVEALRALTAAEDGGMPFEIYAAVTPNKLEPVRASIQFECDREKRTARVVVQGIADLQIEPIRNPVTGDEHRARIVLPEGFEFKEAEVADSVLLRVDAEGPFVFQHTGTYAQLNAFDWHNG